MLASLTSKLIAALVALTVVAGVGWWISNLYDSRATARAALNEALTANATLITDAKRLKSDAKAESDRAQARQRERDGLAAQVATLRQSLGDSLGACKWTDEQAKAVDDFLRGGQ